MAGEEKWDRNSLYYRRFALDQEVSGSYAAPIPSPLPTSYTYEQQGALYRIPLSAFYSHLSTFQIVVKYAHDILGLDFITLSKILGRNYKSVWATYHQVKAEFLPAAPSSKIEVPLYLFAHDTLGPLEVLVDFLREQGLRYAEIGRLLLKDERTIWTTYRRVKQKRGKKQ